MVCSLPLVLLIVQSALGAVISPILVLQSSANGVVYLPGFAPPTPASDSTNPSGETQSALSVPTTSSASILTTPPSGTQPAPTITGMVASSSSVWPASITFVAETSSSTAVGVAFVTTVNGRSMITTTQPQQSLIPATESGSGSTYQLIAITESGTTATLTLDNLPTATLPSQPTGLQIITESGIPVTYSPITLSGYDNTEPVEISTSFTELVNGHTTIQGGWWLIGIGGRIYPPGGLPWKTGSGVGCLAGPAVCRKHCIDIGMLQICNPDGSGGGGGGDETGPPGFPGGPIDGEGEPGGDPPPYEEPSPDEEPEKVTEPDASKTRDATSASMTKPASTSASTSASASTTMSVAQYFIVATPGANVANINAFLGQIAPTSGKTYAPIFPTNTVDGGFWTADLSPEGAVSASSRTDLSIVATYINTPASSTSTPSVFSNTATVDLETLYASTMSPTETAAAIVRRKISGGGPVSDSGSLYQDRTFDPDDKVRSENLLEEREPSKLSERDAGIRMVRQPLSPKDLSVLAWAPSVASVDDVDFIFSERKGENIWVYVLDSKINAQHSEFRVNWPDRFGQFNIDPEVLWDPTTDWSQPVYEAYPNHGTCMASKICGARTGVAKQAKVISVVNTDSVESVLSCLNLILANIISRQSKGQAMPGQTIVSMSLTFQTPTSKPQKNYMQSLLKAIMDLGVVCVCAAGNSAKTLGFPRTGYPAALASDAFPLIPVGAVDNTGAIADFSQEGMIYTVGVNFPCAAYYNYQMEGSDDGTSGGEFLEEDQDNLFELKTSLTTPIATATMAGLIALKLSEPGNIFGFGDDKTQYQQLVKNYYTVGYNKRKPNQHPPGSWYRPKSFAAVAWNGLDGSQRTVCPLTWAPDGTFKKRQTGDPATSSDICSKYNSHSVVIYSRVESGCLTCALDYYVYSVSDPTGVPSKICNGGGFIGSVEKAAATGSSIPFTLPKTADDAADEDLKFVYTWTLGQPAGWISGGSLAVPVSCVAELTSKSSPSQTCSFEASNSEQKRAAQVFSWPTTHLQKYDYAPFARCVWGST